MRAVAFAFAVWWYWRWLARPSWATPLNFASAAAVMMLRWHAGGRHAVAHELSSVVRDVAEPFILCARGDLSSRARFERLMLALTCMTSYFYAYGPLCEVVMQAIALPATTLWTFGALVSDGLLGIGSATGLVVGTVFFHFVYQLTISVLLHRYFSHRAFEASRPVNLLLAIWACAAGQRGPLWWASTHRCHHKHCDAVGDPHSPVATPALHAPIPKRLRAHLLWMTERANFGIRGEFVNDWLMRTPELILVDLLFCDINHIVEAAWAACFAALDTEWVWVPLPFRFTWRLALTLKLARTLGRATAWHTTFGVNSFCHDGAVEAAADGCRSRNIAWFAWLSCGDSYHDNHHRRARAARVAPPDRSDLGFAVMRAAERVGVVHALQYT
jgi:stearoyl-CoA desaturase (delta-9 desaturase)